MKFLILIILLMLFSKPVSSQPVPPVKIADCPSITENPVIDGNADEGFWSAEQNFTIFSLSNEADWSGEADYHITMKFAWGWSYFYTFIEIYDDVEHSWNGTDGNPWEFDNVEWFFQLDTQTVPSTYTDNTIQMRFNRGEAGFQSSTFRAGITVEDFQWYSENTAVGWVLECAIPWTNIMPSGSRPEDIIDWIEEDKVIGFDLSGADSDGTDPLVGNNEIITLMAWDEDGEPGDTADGTEDNAWNNTSVFGYLNLIQNWVSLPNKLAGDSSVIFPNPANSLLYLSEFANYSGVSIYSSVGNLMTKQEITDSAIDISFLKPGLYIVVFDNTDTFKFIKN